MPRTVRQVWAVLTSVTLLAGGCAPRQPFYFFEDGDLSHYVGAIQKLEYPDTTQEPLAEAAGALEPLTLTNADFDSFWDLSLEEAVRTALENGKILRNLGGRFASFGGPRPQTGEPPVSLLTSPQQTPTTYDPAIVETDPFRGTESALAAFDAQLAASSQWQNSNRPQNVDPQWQSVTVSGGPLFVPVLQTAQGVTTTGLSKRTATGAQWGFANTTQLDATNNGFRDVPSTWTTSYDFTFSQPLLQGAGVTYNRIAGPDPFDNLLGRPNFRGVLLARINADISLADFEAGVRNLVSDTEQSYWELAFAYRNLEARKAGRD
ncbi:MAG: hypothetical protein ACKOZU_11195, partial [Planctomycetaceae bacterium]